MSKKKRRKDKHAPDTGHYWQTDTFKQLGAIWDQKLADSGFEDAEVTIDNERQLIQRASNSYKQAVQVVRESKQIYFEMLAQKVHREIFDDPIDAFIMLKLSEGLKIQQISEELKKQGMKCHRQTIRYKIRKYENRWELKTWTPDQLNPPWRSNKKAATQS